MKEEEIRSRRSLRDRRRAAKAGRLCYYSGEGDHPHECSYCQKSSSESCDMCMPCRGPYLGDAARHCVYGCGGCGEVEDEAIMQEELATAQRAGEEARQVTFTRDFKNIHSGTNVLTLSRWPLRLRRQPWKRNGWQSSTPMSITSRMAVGARTAAQGKGACRSVRAARCGTAASRANATTGPTTSRHAFNKAVGSEDGSRGQFLEPVTGPRQSGWTLWEADYYNVAIAILKSEAKADFKFI
jgi:hypothetical protein